MSEMHEPSADDLIARHFSGRFVLHIGGMWFDLHTAREVVEFCASQGIAVVRMDAEWDWPEGRQHAMYDNLQRSLTWREIVQECAECAQMYFQTWVAEEAGFAVSFTFFTEAVWQEHDV